MEITIAGQWELFLYAGLLGVLLGAYYDGFRIIRYLTAQGKRQTFFWDLFYFFSSGVATFLFLLAANQGQMRFYLLAGELIGWCLYHLTLGQVTLFISKMVVKVLQKLFYWVKLHFLKPIWKVFQWIWQIFGKVIKKALNFAKKIATKSKNSLKRRRRIVYTLNKHSPKKKRGKQKDAKKKGRKKHAGSKNQKS